MNNSESLGIRKVYPMTSKKKKMIFAKIKKIKNDIFNENYLKEILPQINDLNDINLEKLLTINNDEYRECFFLEKHFCWISRNIDGKQRYFTKRYLTYSLDIYDLLTIYFNCSFNQLFGLLMELGFRNDSWKENQITKHLINIKEIEDILDKNNEVARLIKDKIDIYIALNDFAMSNSLSFDRYKTNSIFFISTRFLKEKYKLPYAISTINQTINLYGLLGLLYKIPENEIENPIYFEYLKIKSKRASVSFYALAKFDENLNDIKLRSNILIENNIKYYALNKYLYMELKEQYDVFNLTYNCNLGGGDKIKKNQKISLEKDNMEVLFNKYLSTREIVAKEWIKRDLKIKLSDTAFDKKWKEIIKGKRGISVKPTKSTKKKHNLISNQEVFIRREN